MREISEQNPIKDQIKEMQQLNYSYMKEYHRKDISEYYRMCRIIYPIMFSQNNFKEKIEVPGNAENSKPKKSTKRKSSNLNESNHDDKNQIGKVNIHCKKVDEKKKTNIRPLTMKDKEDSLKPVNKSRLKTISSHYHNEKYSDTTSALHVVHKTDTSVQINLRSLTSLIMLEPSKEDPSDLKMIIDTVIRCLKDIINARTNFGFGLVESSRNTCEEIHHSKICSEDEKKKRIVSNRNERNIEYDHEGDKEKRIQALIEQIKYRIRCLCVRRFHQPGNGEKSNEKLEQTAQSQDIGDLSDQQKGKGKQYRKIRENSVFNDTGADMRELVDVNFRRKCYCRDPNEDISEKGHTIDENKIKEREKKLGELLRVIMKKRKCICQEISEDQSRDGVRNLIDNSHEKLSNKSIKSSEDIRRKYSDTRACHKSFRRVSFFNEHSQTEPTSKYTATVIKGTDMLTLDVESSTMSIKNITSSESFQQNEKHGTKDQVPMVSEGTCTPSLYKNDVIINTDQGYEIQVDKLDTGNDNYLSGQSNMEKSEENAGYTAVESKSSDEEFYDTSEDGIENFKCSPGFQSGDVLWERDACYSSEAQETEIYTKPQDRAEESSIHEEYVDTTDLNQEDPRVLPQSKSSMPKKVETGQICNVKCINTEKELKYDDEITANLGPEISRNSLYKYRQASRKVEMISDSRISEGVEFSIQQREENQDSKGNISTLETKHSDKDAGKSILSRSDEKLIDDIASSEMRQKREVENISTDLQISQKEANKSDLGKDGNKIFAESIQGNALDSLFSSQEKARDFPEDTSDKYVKKDKLHVGSRREKNSSYDSAGSPKQNGKCREKKISDASRRKNEKLYHVDNRVQNKRAKRNETISVHSQCKCRGIPDKEKQSKIGEKYSRDSVPQKNDSGRPARYIDIRSERGYKKHFDDTSITHRKGIIWPEFESRICESEPDLRMASRTITGDQKYTLEGTKTKDKSNEQKQKLWEAKAKLVTHKTTTAQNTLQKKNVVENKNGKKEAIRKGNYQQEEKTNKEDIKIVKSYSQSDKRHYGQGSGSGKYREENNSSNDNTVEKSKSLIERKQGTMAQSLKYKKYYKESSQALKKDRTILLQRSLDSGQTRTLAKRPKQTKEKHDDEKLQRNSHFIEQLEKPTQAVFDKNDEKLVRQPTKIVPENDNEIIEKEKEGKYKMLDQNKFNAPASTHHPSKELYGKPIKSMGGKLGYHKHIYGKIKSEDWTLQRDSKNTDLPTEKYKTGSQKLSPVLPSIEENSVSQQNDITRSETNILTKNKYELERESEERRVEESNVSGKKTEANSIEINLPTSDGVSSTPEVRTTEKNPHIDRKQKPTQTQKSISKLPPKPKASNVENSISERKKILRSTKNIEKKMSPQNEILEYVNPKRNHDLHNNTAKMAQTDMRDEQYFSSTFEEKGSISDNIYVTSEENGISIHKKLERGILSITKFDNESLSRGSNERKLEQTGEKYNRRITSIFSRYWERLKMRNEQTDNNYKIFNEGSTENHKTRRALKNETRLSFHDGISTNFDKKKKYDPTDNMAIQNTQSDASPKKSAVAIDQRGKTHKMDKQIEYIAGRIVDDIIIDSYREYKRRSQRDEQITKQHMTKQYTNENVSIQSEKHDKGLKNNLEGDKNVNEPKSREHKIENQNFEDTETCNHFRTRKPSLKMSVNLENKLKNIYHRMKSHTKMLDTIKKRQSGSKRNIILKETKSKSRQVSPPNNIHNESNSDRYEYIHEETRIFTKKIIQRILSNNDVNIRDVLNNIDIDIRKDLEEIRNHQIPEENFDAKFSLADDEIDIAKFAKYADIIEDISLDRAMEMEEFLTKPPSVTKKKSTLSFNERTCNEPSRYKSCGSEEDWSSSSLIKSSKSRMQFYKYNDLNHCYLPYNTTEAFSRPSQVSGRKQFVSRNSEARKAISLGESKNAQISGSCFSKSIALKKVEGNQNICACLSCTSLSTIKIQRVKSNDNLGPTQQLDTTFKMLTIKSQKLETVMKEFQRNYIDQGERISVPSTSSGLIKSRRNITDIAAIHETLSNVRGSQLILTESDMRSRFFSACESRRNVCGYHTSEKLKQYESIEECPKVCSSGATESLSRKIFEQNEFEKYIPQNSLHDEQNIGLRQGKSMQCISEWKKKYPENDSSTASQEVDDERYTNGSEETRFMKRRCISEKCVRFRRCEDVPKNKTNSLNLHKNCPTCSYEKNNNFSKQNTNIYSCSGSCPFPICSTSIPKSQYQFSGSTRSNSKDNHDRNEMNKLISFSPHNECITNSYSKVKRILLTDDTSHRKKQEYPDTSTFSLLTLGNDSPNVYNFNTRIEIFSEKKTLNECRLSKIDRHSVYNNESLLNIQKGSRVRKRYENIVSCTSLKTLEIEDDLLTRSIFSMNISESFAFDKRSFSTLLNILTIPEQRILMSNDRIELIPVISQEIQFNKENLGVIRNDTISTEEEGKNGKVISRILSYNSSDEEEEEGGIAKSKHSKAKINGDRRRKFFHHYEKRRALKLRKTGKLIKEFNSPIKERKPLTKSLSKDVMISTEEDKIFFLHTSSSFNSDGYVSSTISVLDIYGEIWPKKIETKDSLELCRINRESLLTQNKDSMNAITTFPDIFKEDYYGKNIMHDKTSTCIGTNSKATYHPYGQETSLYPTIVNYDVEENNIATTTKEIKRKLTCKEVTKKIVNWIKSLRINYKHEDTIKKEHNEASWNAEVNLMKQRKVLKSKLRYPKTKTSKLYLHKREYNETQLATTEVSKLKMIDPVLKEIPSSEIIEPEYEDEDDEEDSESEEIEEEAEKEKRMLVLSEDSMVLFDRKKVYDRLQQCGKLFYTIYMNEKDDWDHVSIRSAESVEHRVGCEDRPFFATYDLGPNDVRVHVTKDVFEGRKREPIFKNENYVECQNSKVRLSLMRGKRYTSDLDPTKAKIIEIDCTNQFSEIKICYKRTEPSKDCVCEYPQVCKTVQLESSELSSLDMDREDKSQDTRELDQLQNSQEPAESEDVQELQCEHCRNCHEDPETCDNYEKCLDKHICSGKRRVTIISQHSEDVQTVEFCHIRQGFRCSSIDSDKESEKCYWNSNKYSFFTNSNRGDISKHLRRRYKNMRKKTNHHSKW